MIFYHSWFASLLQFECRFHHISMSTQKWQLPHHQPYPLLRQLRLPSIRQNWDQVKNRYFKWWFETYHFLLHFKLFRILGEFLQTLLNRVNIHACIDFFHDCVDSFESIHHWSVDFSCWKLHRNCFKLTGHHIILRHLFSRSH